MIISAFKALRREGVLGINQRNAAYILRYNPRRFYPIVDNKLKTKQLAKTANIATPQLYTTIETEHDVAELTDRLADLHAFAIKPAHGIGGDGILVITDRIRDHYRKGNGMLIKEDELTYHVSNILSGIHSLGGHPDIAIIEYCVQVDPVFAAISSSGVPDIRVITLLGYPAMAMVRLPTRTSDGKANLHQGAIGVGVDLVSGKTFGGVWHNDAIDTHPDTLNAISGITIPHWKTVLQLAAQCSELTGLGYLGVDIVLDQQYGPLMLELNARPGLNIQIANRAGLDRRLRLIEQRAAEHQDNLNERLAFVQDVFS